MTHIVSRATHIVDCRESMGLGKGGGLAQRGTISETGIPDVVAIAMSPGRRHITKPICEITHGLRNEGFQVGVLVLNAGSGVPADAPESARGLGPKFGLSAKEVEQIARHKLAVIHLGGVKTHIIYKARKILRFVAIPAIVVSQTQVDYEDFARIGIKTRIVMPRPISLILAIMSSVGTPAKSLVKGLGMPIKPALFQTDMSCAFARSERLIALFLESSAFQTACRRNLDR